MSKKLIAGLGTVAALGIAALPLAGVFAVDDSAETIVRVRVPESVQCQSTSGTDTDFVWFGTVPIGTTATKGLSVYGATNSTNGFTIVGTATDMTSGTLDVADDVRGVTADFHADTSDASTIAYNKAVEDDGKWWLTTSDANVAISSADNTITLTGTSGVGERTFALTAGVRPKYDNKPGIYQGYINWVCSVNQP